MKITKKIFSLLLCAALLVGYIPMIPQATAVPVAPEAVVGTVTDPGTADAWESMMGTDQDGNRYAGRVWVDKSVYKDGDTVVLNSKGEAGSSFKVELEADEAFQIVFSALGSSMSTNSTVSTTGPMDVVLVLDTSTSMDDEDRQGVTRLERTIVAANRLLDDLLTLNDVRIAIVTYNKDSETVLQLDKYTNGIDLVVTDYYNNGSSDAGVVSAYDNNRRLLGKDDGYTQGTNLQSGIDRGFNLLANASQVEGRIPVAIVLTDGQANRASKDGFYELSSQSDTDGTSASNRNLYLSTLLNAAYNKTKIEEHYGKDASVYTVGVDVSGNTVAQLLMNPADTANGFKDHGRDRNRTEITEAYKNFQKWAGGQTVTHDGWRFDHNYPKQNGAITAEKIAANIYYADTYYDVSNADLEDTFNQIYEELSSGVFNPITSSTSKEGGTGVDDTPLIYADFIGQYMEIKEIQSVTVFGASYGVIKNADGTYTVSRATGTNPTTNEAWNTAEDVKIDILTMDDGSQKLEVRINQEILPIIMEKVDSTTVGGETTSTITEFKQDPLRIYYTVGLSESVLLPNGEVDVSKIQGYSYIDDATGTVSFYSNAFGNENAAVNGTVTVGDAHVGFQPSAKNRYYYHQTHQGIYTRITDRNGNNVTISPNNQYGMLWDEDQYDRTPMSYSEYLAMELDSPVYTTVTYNRPIGQGNAAEEVTYLVYTEWRYLKDSVTFYDMNTETFLNDGKVATKAEADAYRAANRNADLYAILAIDARRTSRLHNMIVEKTSNNTQTAVQSYTPQYLDNQGDHYGNDVVVWLGNNGKLTVQVDTGIALTKAVTETFGNANDTYDLTVTIPTGVSAKPVVVDENGRTVASTYSNNVLTVPVKAGQTVYVNGIPSGTQCQIGEIINGDYYIESKTESVTVPAVSEVMNGAAQYVAATVTNAPYKYGNLFITKEITSEHTVPKSVLATQFEVTVDLGTELAGQTFTVEDSASIAPYQVTVDANGKLVFRIQARQTVEILALPEGTAVSVTETTPDSHFAVSYRTRNHSGETADSDNSLVIPGGGSATTVVLNHYTPASTTVDLDVVINKHFVAPNVEEYLGGGTFNFLAQKYNTQSGQWEDMATASITYGEGEHGDKSVSLNDLLAGEVYTQVGTYSYKVFEQKGFVNNVTYDRAVYTIDVVVTDNGGDLVAQVIGVGNTPITNQTGDNALDYITNFTNTYDSAPISMDIQKMLVNESGDVTVSTAGFKFKSMVVDAAGNPLYNDTTETATNTIYSDATGQARISGVYTRDQVGTHYYLVYEDNTGNPGWAYTQAQYLVTVVVADDENGKLTATMSIEPYNDAAKAETAPTVADGNKGQLYFTNTYDPADASVDLDTFVKKQLTGKTLEAGQFTFYVYNDGDRTSPLLTGTNDANGGVDFDKTLTFTTIGKYQLDIVENIPAGAVYEATSGKYVLNGMRYDGTIYDLVVEVANDSASGQLVATSYFEDAPTNVVTFHNSYEVAPTQYTLAGNKILNGRAPRTGEFQFELYEGNTWLQTVSNKAGGTFTFEPIAYTQPGTYTYTIKEVAGNVAGVRYDGVDHPVTVTVTVVDNNGVLVATADKSNAAILFENTYTASDAYVSFNGTKELKGGRLTDGSFAFRLYATDTSFNISTGSLLATAQNENGAFSFDRSFANPGTYYFAIVEDASAPLANVVYDRTQHNFMVTVTDNGSGQLRAQVTNMITGAASGTAASVSAALRFTNATFEEVTQKEVFIEGNVTTNIDGQKVNAGDILTYFITYTNYTGENVVADIMDTIPAHTSYVAGSASHGGSYVGTHVNWILNVAKGDSVTVSFKVTVDETEAIVANTAVVRDGVNTYSTNQVVNYTLERILDKDVFAPEEPTVSIDGQKVYEGDELLYKVTFTNVTGSAVDVDITDRIPEHTTYVAGSADMGGTYANGMVTWTVEDLAPWASVTVSFKVTVDENIGATTIENQAKANDGTSDYETKWVTNYTVEDEATKAVFSDEAPTINIDGKKVYEGDKLTYAVTYRNTAKEAATVTIIDTIPEYTTYVDGSADHAGVYADGKITWTETVAAGESVTVTFQVVVNADIAEKTIRNQAQVLEGKNSYETNTITNYTVYDEVEKDVFLASQPLVSIDGQKVYAGDTLLYKVTYKNTAKEAATVTITDVIPANTTYVENSADNGGTYADGVITWNLDVEPGQTATVTFQVTVDQVGAATISNKAQIIEGRNTFETNEVTNYTVEDEVSKDVFLAGDTTVSIDGQNVKAGDTLAYEIRYKNTADEAVTVVIVDTIPEHTTYVEGSASREGTLVNGKLAWVLDVAAGEEITVTFQVTVDKIRQATITNQAQIQEGKNTYTTNEVSTPTDNPGVPSTPQTGDDSQLSLWIALLVVSAGGILALTLFGKKKETQ